MIAWLLKTTIGRYVTGALVALLLAYGPAMYLWGKVSADANCRADAKAVQAAWDAKLLALGYARRADEERDATELAALDAKIKEQGNALKDAARVCFDRDNTKRLRSLWH